MRTWQLLSRESGAQFNTLRQPFGAPRARCDTDERAAAPSTARSGGASMDSDARARDYHRRQLWLALAGPLVAAGYLGALIATGGAITLRDRMAAVTPRWWVQLALALLILGCGSFILTLPLRWVGGFWLPRRFGLLHQSLRRWLWDLAKAATIGGALGVLGAEVVYGLMRETSWW